METTYRPTTFGELVEAGYRHRSVRDEMRENLLAMLARKENPFAGILGYERTVVPALVNAVLARHDVVLLGPTAAVVSVLRLTRLDQILEAYDDEPAALARFGS